MDFLAVFASPRRIIIFIFFPLFSSFPLDYTAWYINIKFLGLKIEKLEFTCANKKFFDQNSL